MKKKTLGLFVLMTMAFTACGENNAITEAVAIENSNIITTETGLILEDVPEKITPETIETEEYGNFVIYNEAQGEAVEIPLADFYLIEGEYLLTSNIPLYYTGGKVAGYAKEGSTITVMDGNTEWLRFQNTEKKDYFTVDFLLVRADELREATSIEVVTTEKVAEPESIIVETEPELLASAETQESEPVQEKPIAETPKTETPKTETPATESVVTEPVTPVVEPEPVVVESNKYTPEEAVAVYRSIMEANGIQWSPDLKNGASWGTGFIFLEKGWIDQNAYSAVESFKMGDSVGNSWDYYYLEITGSDKDCVYITEWHS